MRTPIKVTEKEPFLFEISTHNSEKILQYVFILISVGGVVILFLAFSLLALATCLIFIGFYFLLFHNFDIIHSKRYQFKVDTEQKLAILDNGTTLEYSEKDKLVLNNALSNGYQLYLGKKKVFFLLMNFEWIFPPISRVELEISNLARPLQLEFQSMIKSPDSDLEPEWEKRENYGKEQGAEMEIISIPNLQPGNLISPNWHVQHHEGNIQLIHLPQHHPLQRIYWMISICAITMGFGIELLAVMFMSSSLHVLIMIVMLLFGPVMILIIVDFYWQQFKPHTIEITADQIIASHEHILFPNIVAISRTEDITWYATIYPHKISLNIKQDGMSQSMDFYQQTRPEQVDQIRELFKVIFDQKDHIMG